MHRFRFGSINFEDNRTFCGAHMQQSLDYSQVTFNLEKYIRQIKPLTIEKKRKANPNEKATDREVSQLRGLLGGMAWPSTQTQPHLSASVSLAQATVSGARQQDLALRQGDRRHPLDHPSSWFSSTNAIWILF